MPIIEQYTKRTQATGLVKRQDTTGAFGDGGEALQQAAGLIDQYAQKKAKSDYVTKMSEFQLENIRRQEELSKEDFGPDADLSQIYQQDLEARAAELDISPLMGEQWQSDLANMKGTFAGYGLQEGVRREGIRVKEGWEETITNLENSIALGMSRSDAMALLQEKADALPKMSAEDKMSLMDDATDSLYSTEARRILESSPYKFKEMAKKGEFKSLNNLQQYLIMADNEIERRNKAAAAAKEKATLLNTSLLDPENKGHRAILDEHYNSIEINEGVSLSEGLLNTEPLYKDMTFELVKKYKMVPETMQSTLRAMMNSGTNEQKEYAYNLVGDVTAIGAKGFTTKEIEDSTTFNSLVNVGVDEGEAIEKIQLLKDPEHRKYADFYKSTMPTTGDLDIENTIKEAFDEGMFSGFDAEYVQASLNYDFYETFKNEYMKHGNAEAAKQNTLSIITNNVGQTNLGAGDTVMKDPPEDWVQKNFSDLERGEIKKELKSQFEKDLKDINASTKQKFSTNLDNYVLQPAPNNSDTIKNGGVPKYALMKVDDSNGSISGKALKFMLSGGQAPAESGVDGAEGVAWDFVKDPQSGETKWFYPDVAKLSKKQQAKNKDMADKLENRTERNKLLNSLDNNPSMSMHEKTFLRTMIKMINEKERYLD